MTHTQTQGADGAGTKTAGQIAAERVCHEEQMVIWSSEMAERLAMGDWLREHMSYEDKLGFYADLSEGLRDIVDSAFALASPRTDSAERTAEVREALAEVSNAVTAAHHDYMRLGDYEGWNRLNDAEDRLRKLIESHIAALTAATPYGWAYTWADDDCDGGAVEQKFSRTEPDAANPYISGILPLFAAQPAATPGVPDSLRALSEAASEDWDTNDATPYILGPQIDGEHDRFEVIARGPHGHAKSGDAIRKWQANRMFAVAAVNHVRALIAAQPAGHTKSSIEHGPGAAPMEASGYNIAAQPAGQAGDAGAGRLPDEPTEEMYKAALPWFGSSRFHFEEMYRAILSTAPDSTRTGAAEMELTERDIEAPIYEAFARYVGNADERASDFRMFATGYHAALAARPEAPSDAGWSREDLEAFVAREWPEGRSAGAAARELVRALGARGLAPTLQRLLTDLLGQINFASTDRAQILADFANAAPEAARMAKIDSFERWNPRVFDPTPPTDPAPSGQAEG